MAAGSAAAKVGHLSAKQDSFNGWLMSSLPKFCGWDEEVLEALMLCYGFCWTQHEQQRAGGSCQPGMPFPEAGVGHSHLIVSR